MSEFPRVTSKRWRERVEHELGGRDFSSLRVALPGGLRLAPLYTSMPTRHPALSSRPPEQAVDGWERCQLCDDPAPEAAHARLTEDLANGIDAAWVRLDAVARQGLDATDPVSTASIGCDGVAAYDVEDWCRLLGGTRPASLWIDAGGNALPAAALVVAAFDRLGLDPESIRLRFCADPLGALARDGCLPASHATLGWEAAMLARLCHERWPSARAWLASSTPYSQSGAGAALELAATLATTVEYLRYCSAAGVAPEIAGGQMTLSFDLDRNLLVELAKLRAARVLWAKVQSVCGAAPSAAYIHAGTGARTQAIADPWTNALRATVQTTAAALAGVQSITVAPFDRRLGGSSDRGRRVARNTQAILNQESHLGEVLDPAAGAYAVETLTDEIARAAWELLRRFDADGMASCLVGDAESSTLRVAIAAAAAERVEALSGGRLPVLGVSHHPAAIDEPAAPGDPDRAAWRGGIQRRFRDRAPARSLASLAPAVAATSASTGPGQMFDALMTAAADGATVWELGSALRHGERGQQRVPALEPVLDDAHCEATP